MTPRIGTATTGFLDRPDGGRLHWRQDGPVGAGPKVVLLGPEHRTLAIWPDVFVTDVVASGASCVRLDWRDQGRSESGDSDLTLEMLCDDVIAVLPAEADPLIIVGVGLGATVARHVAVARPGADVILVNASDDYLATTVMGPDEADVVRVVLRPSGGRPGDDHRRLVREVRVLAGPVDGPDGEGGQVDAVVESWLAAGQRSSDRHRAVVLAGRPPLAELERDCAASVAVLHGSDNRFVPPDHGSGVAARFGVPLTAIAGAGHHLGPALRRAIIEVLAVRVAERRRGPGRY